MANWKILDCTLRDGGYYTNWDFDQDLVRNYLLSMANLPVSFIELGYRAFPEKQYVGAYYYLPRYLLEWAREVIPDGPDFAIMLNAKNVSPDDVSELLEDCKGLVRLVRMALDPEQIEAGIRLAREIKKAGFEVGVNLMYLSKDYDRKKVFRQISENEDVIDYIALVDSFGACYPEQVGRDFKLAKSIISKPVGFHGHDNITLAFANSLAAIENGADIVDSTICGMGRGAGNLRTELIAGYYYHQKGDTADFLTSSKTLKRFGEMKVKYGWGAEVPYIVAGLNNLPQAKVMDWISQNRYSTSAIVKALTQASNSKPSNYNFPELKNNLRELEITKGVPCLVLGGGDSVRNHSQGLARFASNKRAVIVHASTRHVGSVNEPDCTQLVCIVGDEYEKADENTLLSKESQISAFVVDSHSYVGLPENSAIVKKIYSTSSLTADNQQEDAVLGKANPIGVALATCIDLGATEIYLAGFDGYAGQAGNDSWLAKETQDVLDSANSKHPKLKIQSLTPTNYDVSKTSLYAKLA